MSGDISSVERAVHTVRAKFSLVAGPHDGDGRRVRCR